MLFKDLKTVNQPGYDSGLILELFSGQSENLMSQINSGMTISIDNYRSQVIYYRFTDLSSGTFTSILMEKKIDNMMPSPYSSCSDKPIANKILTTEIERLNLSYSQEFCYLACYQVSINITIYFYLKAN